MCPTRGHPHRDLRLPGRPAAVPPEPGAGEELLRLPRSAGHPALPAGGGHRRGRLLAVGAATRDRATARRHRGVHRADRNRGGRGVLHGRRPRHRPQLPGAAGHGLRLRRAERPHGATCRRPGRAVLPGAPRGRGRHAVRPAGGGAAMHPDRQAGQPSRGCRRRPAAAATGLGGVGRRAVDRLRDGPRHHRRPQPARRNGGVRARRAHRLGDRRAPGGLAALPGH